MRRENARRNFVFHGSRGGHVVGADLDVIDQDVGIVNGGRQVVRRAHIAIHDEFEMMRARGKLDDCG